MKRWTSLLGIVLVLTLFASACGPAQPAQLGNYTWIDADADGIQDSDEDGLEGVTVRLYNSADTLVAQTESDNKGFYGFAEVSSGDYYLEFVPPERYYDEDDTETTVTFRLTLKDQGESDLADSDANPDTRWTDIFSFDTAGEDLSRDAGFVPLAVDATPTPTATPEPTNTPEDDDDGDDGDDGDGNGGKNVVNIPAAEDSFIITTKSDWVFGSDEAFLVWGDYSYVYLRFSLADIPAGAQIPYAKLHLKIRPNSTAQGLKVWIQILNPDQVWTQATLNGNNAPRPDQDVPYVWDLLLGSYSGEGSEDVLDVTTLVQYAIDHGYSVFDMVIGGVNLSDEHIQEWYSSESGKGPVLEVDP